MRWNRKYQALSLCLVIAITHIVLSCAFAADYEWRNVVQKVEILPNGDVLIDDTRTLWAKDDFGEAFICLDSLTPSQSVEMLTGSGAVGGSVGSNAFTQRCENGSGGTELVVKHDRRIKEGRVRFYYKLTGSTDFYSDVAQWYWIIMEQEHPPLKGYELTVKTPEGAMSEPFDAYVHRFGNLEKPTVVLSEDRTTLNLSFKKIRDGDGVEIRYLMDPVLFSVKGEEAGLEKLAKEEAKINGSMKNMQRRRQFRSSMIWLLFPVFMTGGLFSGIYRAGKRFEPKVEKPKMKYVFEPPSDWAPAAVIAMMSKNYNSGAMGPAFNATIMDLARQGFGEFRSKDGKGKKFEMQLFDKDTQDLEHFEVAVLDYLKKAAGSDDYIEFEELKKYSEKNLVKSLPLWGKQVRTWVESELGGELTLKESVNAAETWGLRVFLMLIASGVGIALTLDIARAGFIVACILSVIGFVVVGSVLPVWRPEVAEKVEAWNGFKRTLSDYSQMKDAPNDFYVLWDRYFCYAAGFGVAAAFLRNIRKAAPLKGVDEKDMMRSSSWMGSDMSSSSFSNFSKSVSSLSSSLSASSGSSSSGGSSSGGGGGGGGGSSGGR